VVALGVADDARERRCGARRVRRRGRFALGVAIGAIYGQTTVGDIVIARYTADAWRGRVYAVRYFLTFITSGIAVQLIAMLYARGGYDLVLSAIALTGFTMLTAVYTMAVVVSGAEQAYRSAQPAE